MLGILTRVMEEGAARLRRFRHQRARRRMLLAVREFWLLEGDFWRLAPR